MWSSGSCDPCSVKDAHLCSHWYEGRRQGDGEGSRESMKTEEEWKDRIWNVWMGNAISAFPLPSSRAPLRSELHPHVHKESFRDFQLGGHPVYLLTWVRTDCGHFLTGSLVFQAPLEMSVVFKDVAWPEGTSACNFKQQQTLSSLSAHRLVYENQESEITMPIAPCPPKC